MEAKGTGDDVVVAEIDPAICRYGKNKWFAYFYTPMEEKTATYLSVGACEQF